MFEKLSKPLTLLLTLLVVVLVSSFGASLVQNSFFKVDVSRVSFETENGELAGYLYMPRGVDADNPAPTVILTHGYLNNAEMQEIGAIELSKRGYVVLAFSMYDHGDSTWDTPGAFSFFADSVYDAVQYMYDQDYVLKDADGNGMIGVSGHSMGGFSTEYAVIFDEMDFATNGFRKISVSLAVGADFRYVFAGPDPYSFFADRSSGVIAAHFDQFFFDNVTPGEDGSVRYKDYVADPVGLAFLGQTEATAGEYYEVAGGQRVIYTPYETHPQNTWSLESGANTIEFFETAFAFQLNSHDLGDLEDYGITVGTTGQSWWAKEMFTLIALVALIAMIFPAFALISKFPVFNKVYSTEESTVSVSVPSKEKTFVKFAVGGLATLISAYYITIFMDRNAKLEILSGYVFKLAVATIGVVVLIWIAAMIVKSLKPENNEIINMANKATAGGAAVVFVSIAFRWLLDNPQIITNNNLWGAPSVNTIVYWALASAGLILLITLISSFYFNAGEKVENPYGLKASPLQVLASLLNAVALVILLLLIVAVVGWVFNTDFRFYTFAIQIFNRVQFAQAWVYVPLFLIYYFAAGISVFVNTRHMKKAWLADIYAAFLLAGPIVLFLIYQYGTLYNTGVAAYPTFSLSAILTVGLVPVLTFAAIIVRRLSLKTGNIYTSVFFNAIFFTLITLANTVVYQLSVG